MLCLFCYGTDGVNSFHFCHILVSLFFPTSEGFVPILSSGINKQRKGQAGSGSPWEHWRPTGGCLLGARDWGSWHCLPGVPFLLINPADDILEFHCGALPGNTHLTFLKTFIQALRGQERALLFSVLLDFKKTYWFSCFYIPKCAATKQNFMKIPTYSSKTIQNFKSQQSATSKTQCDDTQELQSSRQCTGIEP